MWRAVLCQPGAIFRINQLNVDDVTILRDSKDTEIEKVGIAVTLLKEITVFLNALSIYYG